MAKDLLGRDMTATEEALVEAYEGLQAILERDDLTPCTKANVSEAVASLWQALNELALTEDRPDV